MTTDKRFLFFICLLLLVPLCAGVVFYLANPFNNKCIEGNCTNGYGAYSYASGMKYKGEWKKGKRDGQGTLTYSDGSQYTGSWKKDRMQGPGTKIYASDPSLKKYSGEWGNGNENGTGTMLFAGGARYIGEWKDGKMNGRGTYTTINGRTISGEWKDGIVFGQVTEKFPDGRILEIKWENGRRQGVGIMTYPDGTKITGEWIDGKLSGSLDFYLFRNFEFQDGYTIAALSNAINKDIHVPIKVPTYKISWLNELLKTPDLHEKLYKKINDNKLSEEIGVLLESTRDFRNSKFSELTMDKQKDIIKLNRLLIEHLYPGLTPKV
jgi:hypothetical protein